MAAKRPPSSTFSGNLVPGVATLSSLPLQISLHFNVYYSPLWILAVILGLVLKFEYMAVHYKAISIAVSVLMFLSEPARLYLGYEGNLREKIPELAGSWLLTIAQLALALYTVANVDSIVLPIEIAALVPLICLLVLEVLFGLRALQVILREQSLKFHLRRDLQVSSIDHAESPPDSGDEEEGNGVELKELKGQHLHQD